MSEYRAQVIEEFNLAIKNFSGVRNYYVSISQGRLKEKFLVRLWIKEIEYDAHNIADILSGDGDFQNQLKAIASKIDATVVFDIYHV